MHMFTRYHEHQHAWMGCARNKKMETRVWSGNERLGKASFSERSYEEVSGSWEEISIKRQTSQVQVKMPALPPQDTSVLVSGPQAKSSKPQHGHLTRPEFVQSQNWQMRPLL